MSFQGVSGARGIEIGTAYVYQNQDIVIDNRTIPTGAIEKEIERLQAALQTSRQQILCVRDRAAEKVGEDEAKIFEAHLMIVDDPAFSDDMINAIREECASAAAAVETVTQQYVTLFSEMDDEYMRERAADIRDIGERLLRNVLGIPPRGLDHLNEEVIVIAHDLTPSDTVSLDVKYVKGFATDIGGPTSHAAIIARTLEIPAVLGLGDVTAKIATGDTVILDGVMGTVILCPDQDKLAEYKEKRERFLEEKMELRKLSDLPAVTRDGKSVEIAANIGSPQDIDIALSYGADGVGLYRTEFLYLDQDRLPTEEEQFHAYKVVAEKLGGKPLIIRTLDIGGDKELACLSLPQELNPFLGYRAIRICLDRTELFKTQLKAILRASAFGNILIMYPMISGVGEVRQANAILDEVRQELRQEQTPFDANIKVGVMIEIPAAAITADAIIREVDFFSIGTNDLCQYTLAVDRMNEKISALYQPLHPAVLRLIKNTIDASHRHGKFTGMCGELAGDPLAAAILLGLGLDEFSMSASSMTRVKKVIRGITFESARQIAETALTLGTPEEIVEHAKAALTELDLL